MAHLTASRLRAQDNSGNAYALATLTVYETGTTNPAELYSTAALAAVGGDGDLANPVTSNSAGYFPAIFLGENVTVDLLCEDSEGNDLWQANAVQGVPGGTDAIAVDLGDDGRFRVTGDSGIVQIEVGDPTGDESGGDVRWGGWAGTQGGHAEIDFAEVEVTGDQTTAGNHTIGGDLTFDGGQTPDLVVLEGSETTAVATKTLTLPTGYEFLEVDIYNLAHTSGSGIRIQLSYDNGATFKSTNEYDWNHTVIFNGGLSHDFADASAYIQITDDSGAEAAGVAHHFRLNLVSTTDKTTGAWWDGVIVGTTSQPRRLLGSAMTVSNYGKVTALKIYPITGTIAFKYMVRARRRST